MTAATVAAGVLLVAGVGVRVLGTEDRGPDLTPITREPTATPIVTATPLEGTWRTDTLTVHDLRAALGTDVERHLPAIEDDFDAVSHHIRLTVHRDVLKAVVVHGRRTQEVDAERIEVTGDRLLLRAMDVDGWSTTYRWTIRGDLLTLVFLRTSEGDTDGVPGEAWQRALYTTGPSPGAVTSAGDVRREVLAGEGGAVGDEVGGRALEDDRPPSWPAPGPRSMIQSACAITAWWCSMTITDLPESTSRSSRPSRCSTSARCRPVVGSSRT